MSGVVTADGRAEDSTGQCAGEGLALAVLLLAFLAVNLITSVRSPVVWTDEVLFTDPAQNLASGHGFVSSAWAQPVHQFFAGNVPLYSLLLSGWIKIVGFGVWEVRSFDYVLMAVTAAVLWVVMRRSGVVKTCRGRIVAIAVILLCNEVTFAYRSARYDVLGILLCAIAGMAFTAKKPAARFWGAAAIGVLLPMAGLQLVIYAAVMCALLWAFMGRESLKFGVALFAGIIAGMGILCWVYAEHGLLPFFMRTVLGDSSAAEARTFRGLVKLKAGELAKDVWEKPSLLPLFVLLGMMIALQRKLGIFRWRSPAGFGIAAGLGVPLALHAIYAFPVYYGWMSDIPMIICGMGTLIAFSGTRYWKSARMGALICLEIVAALGLPARLAITGLEWQRRDYAPVESFVNQFVTGADRVVTAHAAYYPVKTRAAACFTWYHLDSMSPSEKAQVTAMVLVPDEFASYVGKVGGKWSEVAEMPPPAPDTAMFFRRHSTDQNSYQLAVYRRTD